MTDYFLLFGAGFSTPRAYNLRRRRDEGYISVMVGIAIPITILSLLTGELIDQVGAQGSIAISDMASHADEELDRNYVLLHLYSTVLHPVPRIQEYVPLVQASSSPTHLGPEQGLPLPPESSWTCPPEVVGTAVFPCAGPNGVTATFDPRASFLETYDASHVRGSESPSPLAPSHRQSLDCSDDHGMRLGIPHQGQDSLSPNRGSELATSHNAGLQQVLGPSMQSPRSWTYSDNGDTTGQQVAQTLLHLRGPRLSTLASPISTELPVGSIACPPNNAQLTNPTHPTNFSTLQWHASSSEPPNSLLGLRGSQSLSTDMTRLQGEPGGGEIDQDSQWDGHEDHTGKEDLFGGCLGDVDLLFEREPSGSGF